MLARQAAKQRRLALARIELALRDLRRGRYPNLTGITFDVVFEDEDGNEIDDVELDPDTLRVLLEAERGDLRDQIDQWNQKAEMFAPVGTQLRCQCPGEVRHRTTPRPRERRERRARSCSSSSSGDDSGLDSDSDPPALGGLLLLRARGPPRPPSFGGGPAPAAVGIQWASQRAVGAAAPTERPRRPTISKQAVPILPEVADDIERRPLVHTSAPTRVTNAQLADQLLSIAIELDRRGALKRARDRRYRARRIADRRSLHVLPGGAA